MPTRLLLAIAAMLTLAACSAAPTAPRTLKPGARSADVTQTGCRTGYHVATRSDGTSECEPD
jgi:hypothetical protein